MFKPGCVIMAVGPGLVYLDFILFFKATMLSKMIRAPILSLGLTVLDLFCNGDVAKLSAGHSGPVLTSMLVCTKGQINNLGVLGFP